MANTGIIIGPVTVGANQNRYVVEPWTPAAPGRPVASASPSWLLAARYQVVAFTGRTQDLADLTGWREGADRVSVRLLYGPGGQGKTRLAAQFAAVTAAVCGWQVYTVRHDSTLGPPAQSAQAPAAARGVLIVIDYAERWPTDDLLTVMRHRLLTPTGPIRLLLVSRPAGPWWQGLRHHLGTNDIPTTSQPLPPLADTPTGRQQAFTHAVTAFAGHLGITDPSPITPPAMVDPAWQLVLTIHMVALAAVDAHTRGATPPVDPAELSAYLLDRETAHQQALHDNHRITTTPEVIGRTVYTAILTRALPHPQAVDVPTRVAIADPHTAGTVLDDHRVCYPPTDPDTVCEPLYPDRLAEDFLALTTPGHRNPDYIPDPWATAAAHTLLTPRDAPDGGQPWPYTPAAITVLVETSRRWPHIGHRVLYPLLRAHPHLALAAGGATLTRLADTPHVDLAVLEAIEPLFPPGRHVGLDTAIAQVTTRLTEHRLTQTTDDAERARLQATLGYRLTHAGLHHQALAATVEAVEVYRRLAHANPAAFEPDLAGALNNLGIRLSNLGRREEALAATVEAVEIRRRLAHANPAAFEPDLAGALNNISVDLSNLGRREEALAATVEAVEIRRRLAHANPAAFEPDLARGLWSFAWVRAAGEMELEQALVAVRESVTTYERLVRGLPDAFTDDLRGALTTYVEVLVGLGRDSEASDIRHRIEGL